MDRSATTDGLHSDALRPALTDAEVMRVHAKKDEIKKRCIAVVLATLGMSTTLSATAGSAHAAAALQVPFKATYSGVVTPPQGPPPKELNGAGQATHLGRSTDQGRASVVGSPARCPNNGFLIQNDEVLTSIDDGDQITLTIQDQSCMTGPSTIHGEGTYVITGGTGRFAGASGQGAFVGDGDFAQGTFSFTLNGTISRPIAD
jgi:hypothetical protein